jgi:hypothetical protein
MNLVELKHVKDKNVENENVESGLIPFEPTPFKYKCKITDAAAADYSRSAGEAVH